MKKRVKTLFKDRYLLILFILSAVCFLYFYWINVERPGGNWDGGWYKIWYDQRMYHIMVRKLFLRDFSPGGYAYALGYPILGAFFYRFLPQDPFLIPNLILFIIANTSFYLAIKNLINKEIAFVGSMLLIFATSLVQRSVVPWTSNVTSALGFLSFYLITTKYSWKNCLLFGLTTGYSFFSRYADGVILLPFLWLYILKFLKESKFSKKSFKLAIRGAFVSHFIFGVFVILMLAFNKLVFGTFLGSYLSSIKNTVGFDPIKHWPDKVIGIIVNSFAWHHNWHVLSTPLLGDTFVFVFWPLGLFLFLKSQFKKWWHVASASMLSVVFWVVFYIPHRGNAPHTLLNGSLHYFKVIYAVLAFFSIYPLVTLIKSRKKSKTVIIYLLIFLAIISFIEIFKPQPLPAAAFSIKASVNQEASSLALDNDLKTRWSTQKPQQKEDFLIIENSKNRTIRGVKIESQYSPGGCPESLVFEESNDKITWQPIFSYKKDLECSYLSRYFYPRKSKHFRIRLTDLHQTNWWSVNELTLFGQ